MTKDQNMLRRWERFCGFATIGEAATALRLSYKGYWNYREGKAELPMVTRLAMNAVANKLEPWA